MKKRRVFLVLVIAVLLVGILYGGYRFSKSRKHQFVGEIINRIETEEKVVALTFDDGPTAKTEEILQALESLDIKAAFFLTGQEIEENSKEAESIVKAGHQIGNHSYSHNRMMFKSKAFIEYEIDKTTELIKASGYKGTVYFRAPYCKKLFLLPIALKKRNMVHVTWDVEPDSYLPQGTPAEKIADYVIENTSSGSIILMHPMYINNQANIDALPIIVKGLREKGYVFLTVEEMLK